MTLNYRKQIQEAAEHIQNRSQIRPEIGLLTGTGLGDSAEGLRVSTRIEYREIPHFPVSTVESHRGRLLMGTLHAKGVLAFQGRFHLYEGYSPREVTFPIRVMQQLGVKYLIISNAAGGLNPTFKTGDIMVISDHINLTGANPLVGENENTWGIRFPDMNAAYDNALQTLARKAARSLDVNLRKGVYAGLKGPSLETPAEVRFLQTIGSDAVGFSTVQEVIAAVHGGIRVLGLSTITNINDPDAPQPATVEEIIAVANAAAPGLQCVIERVVREL